MRDSSAKPGSSGVSSPASRAAGLSVVVVDGRGTEARTKSEASAAALRLLIAVVLHNAGFQVVREADTPDVLCCLYERSVVISTTARTLELDRPFTRAALIDAIKKAHPG